MGGQTNLQVLAPVTALIAAMLVPPAGRATGGRYAFAGGTSRQRALTAPARALLLRRLGATVWCSQKAVRRDRLGCERFASTLAWAYWPSPENCMRPVKALAASGTQFRKLVSTLIRGGR